MTDRPLHNPPPPADLDMYYGDGKPLTEEEVKFLLDRGWRFTWAESNDGRPENYAYVPDDEDGQMAQGTVCIRRVIEGYKTKEAIVQ